MGQGRRGYGQKQCPIYQAFNNKIIVRLAFFASGAVVLIIVTRELWCHHKAFVKDVAQQWGTILLK